MKRDLASAFLKVTRHFGLEPDQGSSRPLHILVVDDEESVRRFVKRVLTEAGCHITIAGDGDEALAVAAHLDAIDMLVTDLMMPHMNGDELARRLRARHPDLAVLYLTGFSDRLFAERLTLWEHEAFLDKPCSIVGLKEAVSLLVTGHVTVGTAPDGSRPASERAS